MRPKVARARQFASEAWCAARMGCTLRDRILSLLNAASLAAAPLETRLHSELEECPICALWHVRVNYQSPIGHFALPGRGRYYAQLLGSYEPQVVKVIKQIRVGTFVDVGANVGTFTVLASKTLGNRGNVLSLEPCPPLYALLQHNVNTNDCRNVETLPLAAWNRNAKLKLYRHRPGLETTDNSVAVEVSTRYDTVEGIALDDLSDRLSPPVTIKVDVEGAELEVLKGLSRVLDLFKPTIIFEELPPSEVSQSWLNNRGYNVVPLDQGNNLATFLR